MSVAAPHATDGRSADDFVAAILAAWPRVSGPDTAPRAIALCDEAIAAFPEQARFHIHRGDLVQLVDDADSPWPLEESMRCYERALVLDPRNEEAWFELGMFWDVVMANPRKARQYLHKAFLLRRARERSGAAR